MSTLHNVKLGEIADIINGIPDTKQSELNNNVNAIIYNYIQPNHLSNDTDVKDISAIKRQVPISDEYFIRKEDILVKRLNPDIATFINKDMPNTTFSSNLFVIRVRKDYYPTYIACFLENQGMSWLNSNLVGSVSSIKSISIKALVNLDIPRIEYKKQITIGHLWQLQKRKKELVDKLLREDERLMTAVLDNVIADAKGEK